MEVKEQGRLAFFGVDIVNINFNTENRYDHKSPVKMEVDPKVFFPKELPTQFKIVMTVKLMCESFFELKFLAVGSFDIQGGNDEKERKALINTNAPAIMFPYVRSFISTLTASLGEVTGHLIVPAQFFKGELEELPQENIKE